MGFDTIFSEPAHGEVIDADGHDFGFREKGRGFFRNVNEIFKEGVGGPGGFGIPGFKEDAFAGFDLLILDFFDFDGFLVLDLDQQADNRGQISLQEMPPYS